MNENPPLAQQPKSFLDTKYGELTFRESLDHIDRVLTGLEGQKEIDAREKTSQGSLDLDFLIYASKLLDQVREGVEKDSAIGQDEKQQVAQKRESLVSRVGGVIGKVKRW